MKRALAVLAVLVAAVATVAAMALVPALAGASGRPSGAATTSQWGYAHKLRCPGAPTCTETYQYLGPYYTGHDEPSVLFYSNTRGSGNHMYYGLQLPKDPPTPPYKGGTPNFELHPAFWFGVAMCDTQSAPNPGGSSVGPSLPCKPDSDSNIYNSPDPSSPAYIGKHPGTAFMEMQFYPPGWAPFQLPGGISCSARQWCAALNIDSYSLNMNTGVPNNSACLNTVGIEPVNFAFITKNGIAQAPANPVDATAATYTPNRAKDLFMSSGDHIIVAMQDTKAGFKVTLDDVTTGQVGSMTASKANGFGQVNYRPGASKCTETPYAFHPMYATSSVNTRVPWAAHSYNVAFADEIGHFEFCDPGAVTPSGTCLSSTRTDFDGVDSDDVFCLPASVSTRYRVNGCVGTDIDFDGTPYLNDWPGTLANASRDRSLHAQPIRFTSPVFLSGGRFHNYSQVAFEADLPRIEGFTTPPCQRHVTNPSDPSPGSGCVNPPLGSSFYPFFSTGGSGPSCFWQLGGAHIPGTVNDFGGSSATEFGTAASGNLLGLFYPTVNDTTDTIYEDFRNIQSSNPCMAGTGAGLLSHLKG
jgi:hypothetical protein